MLWSAMQIGKKAGLKFLSIVGMDHDVIFWHKIATNRG